MMDIYKIVHIVALSNAYKFIYFVDIHPIYKKNQITMNTSTRTTPRRSKRLCKALATSTRTKCTRVNLQHGANHARADPPITTTTTEKVTKVEKEKRNLILSPLISCLISQKMSTSQKRLPRNAYTQIVEKYKVHYPWVTTDMLKQRVKRACSKLTESHTASLTNPTLPNCTNTNTDREKEKANPIKGGRPKGSTVAAKALMQSCIDEAKSDICDLYKKEKYEDQHSKPVYGSYKWIFNKVKKETFQTISIFHTQLHLEELKRTQF
jgi:hypothetical protein